MCSDGSCVPNDRICDGVDDCDTDETNSKCNGTSTIFKSYLHNTSLFSSFNGNIIVNIILQIVLSMCSQCYHISKLNQ